MKKLFSVALSVMMSAFMGAAAHAETVTAEQTIEVVKTEAQADGSVIVSYEPATRVVPGEQLRYTISYSNGTDAPAEDIVLTMPIEDQLTYVEGSAATPDATVLFSADEGVSFRPRGEVTVTIDGETRAATADEITHVSWRFDAPLAPGADGKVSLLAVLK